MNHRPRYRLEQLAWAESPEDGVIRGRVELAVVIPLFPPAAAGEQPRLPAHLSPRAGSGTRRLARRLSRSVADLRTHGLMVGLLVAAVLCIVLTRGQFVTWDGLQDIPTGSAR